jgi:hypothetical protein
LSDDGRLVCGAVAIDARLQVGAMGGAGEDEHTGQTGDAGQAEGTAPDRGVDESGSGD